MSFSVDLELLPAKSRQENSFSVDFKLLYAKSRQENSFCTLLDESLIKNYNKIFTKAVKSYIIFETQRIFENRSEFEKNETMKRRFKQIPYFSRRQMQHYVFYLMPQTIKGNCISMLQHNWHRYIELRKQNKLTNTEAPLR